MSGSRLSVTLAVHYSTQDEDDDVLVETLTNDAIVIHTCDGISDKMTVLLFAVC